MKQKTFLVVTGVIFSILTILHVLRLIGGWRAEVENITIPIWASWLGVFIAGFLAYNAFQLSKKIKK